MAPRHANQNSSGELLSSSTANIPMLWPRDAKEIEPCHSPENCNLFLYDLYYIGIISHEQFVSPGPDTLRSFVKLNLSLAVKPSLVALL